MAEELNRLVCRAFPHLVGALPQLRSFSGVGGTTYAIVAPEGGEVSLQGPALSPDGVAGWHPAACAAALDLFRRRQRAGSVTVLLVVCCGGTWHCAAVGVPSAEKLATDDSIPLACANAVLGA